MAQIIRPSGVVRRAVLHCAAVPTGWANGLSPADMVQRVTGWHKANGWATIGYHYVIAPDGCWAHARDHMRDGAHVAGHNSSTLGILLVEHTRIDKIGRFHDYFTESQAESVRRILAYHQISDVVGHNDLTSKKLCPGFRVIPSQFLLPLSPA